MLTSANTANFTTLPLLLLLVPGMTDCAAPAATTIAPEPNVAIEPTAVSLPTKSPVEE